MSVLTQLRTKLASNAKQEKLAMIKKATQLCRPSQAQLQKYAAATKEINAVLEKYAINFGQLLTYGARGAHQMRRSYAPLIASGVGAAGGGLVGAAANPDDMAGGAFRGAALGGLGGLGGAYAARALAPALTRAGIAQRLGEKVLETPGAKANMLRGGRPASEDALRAVEHAAKKPAGPDMTKTRTDRRLAESKAKQNKPTNVEASPVKEVEEQAVPPGMEHVASVQINLIKKATMLLKKQASQEKRAIDPETAALMRYWATRLGTPAIGGSLLGAGAGAIAGGEGHRLEGAGRGALYGGAAGLGAGELSRLAARSGVLGAGIKKTHGLNDALSRAAAHSPEKLDAEILRLAPETERAGSTSALQLAGAGAVGLGTPIVAGAIGGEDARHKQGSIKKAMAILKQRKS
jgi:hypothetical protein